MNGHPLAISGAQLVAMPSGALWWPAERALVVADLHLCKSSRAARRSGRMLPPYETRDTLARLARDMAGIRPRQVICVGDSFDDAPGCAELDADDADTLARLQEGIAWIWVEGNHDRAAEPPGGTAVAALALGPLHFRHIAGPGAAGEVSGHYHPKARLHVRGKMISRPAFLHDDERIVLPAYGTYTGGLEWTSPVFARLFPHGAVAVLTGLRTVALPMPRTELTP